MSRLWLKSKSTLVGSAKVITIQNPGKGLPEDPDDYALYRLTRVNFEDTLREMMFGFGECVDPHPDSVELLDTLVKDFMTKLTMRCLDISRSTGHDMNTEIVKYVVRPNEQVFGKKMILRDYYFRLCELMKAFDEISRRVRYPTSDEDYSAAARRRRRRAERTLAKLARIQESSDSEE